jgi:hypothetical protein
LKLKRGDLDLPSLTVYFKDYKILTGKVTKYDGMAIIKKIN